MAVTQRTAVQDLVRLVGTSLFLALLASVPVSEAIVRLGDAGGPLPAPDAVGLRRGSYMLALERQLQEGSPVVRQLRGSYNEWRFRLGVLQNDKVCVGDDGWMFYRVGMDPPAAVVDGLHAQRTAVFAGARALLRQLGAELFVVLLPDKERIYPEHAYGAGGMPAAKARLYPLLLGELQAAGLPHLDAAAALSAAKAAAPAELLYYRRDSHWTPHGARVVAGALARELQRTELRELLGPEQPGLVASEPRVVELLPDLVDLCRLRSVLRPMPEWNARFPFPGSALTGQLVESKQYFWPRLPGGDLDRLRAEAPVALAGTSFSGENGATFYALTLRRVIDDRVVMAGAGSLASLGIVTDRLREQPGRIRLVLWELVERGVLEGDWVDSASNGVEGPK